MKQKGKLLFGLLAVLLVGAVVAFLARDAHLTIFEPAGTIAERQRHLMIITLLLSVIVVVPVFIMTFIIVWKYREKNAVAAGRQYKPDWDRQNWIEFIWWAIPCAIILVLAVITWRATHQLDPYKALDSH